MDKHIILVSNIEVENRTVVSNKIHFGIKRFKYFIGYQNDDKKVMPMCIMLPKTIKLNLMI